MLVDIHTHELFFKQVCIVQHALRWQLLQAIDIISSVLRVFRFYLVILEYTKTLKHHPRLLRLPACKIVKGIPCQPRHVLAGDSGLHDREILIFVIEVLVKADRSRKVDRVLECQIWSVLTLEDFDQLPHLSLVGHIEAGVLVVAQIFYELAVEHLRLVQVCFLIFSFADFSQLICSSIKFKILLELIRRAEEEVYLVREISNIHITVVIRRHDVNIEIALRLGSAALSRKSHKEIAFPEDIVAVPVQVVFVNLKIRDVFLRVPFKAVIDNRVEVSVQFCWSQQRCLLVDLFIVVNDFVDIDIVLIVDIIMDNELSRDRRHDILECRIDNAK